MPTRSGLSWNNEGRVMRAIQQTYFRLLFHPHFVVVHLVGLVFGVHLAVASLFAIVHHSRRSLPNGRRLPPAGAYDEFVAQAVGLHPPPPD